jgi:predicted acylesterase/phospholipase RssA
MVQAVQIMGEELNTYQSRQADLIIKPDLKEIDQFDFDRSAYIIKMGELAAENAIKMIRTHFS